MPAPSRSQTEPGRWCELLAAIQMEEGRRTQRLPPGARESPGTVGAQQERHPQPT